MNKNIISAEIYSNAALDQIPRLLGNLDRNQFSSTYGSFHRDYWLEKTSDFPDAVRQFAVHALALVYKHDFPNSKYQGNRNLLKWTIAALDYWAKIQHKDGSFDEFYPNERGWVGPTGFTTYACAEAFNLIKDEIPADVKERVKAALIKAAFFIGKGESEEDHLGNHHAMACLAVHSVMRVLGRTDIEDIYRKLWDKFLTYYQADEGWCREYDGPDPGYLSAVVSFLAKIYVHDPRPEIFDVLSGAVETCSYFLYPDGSYGGILGSRNTIHLYPHGFELLSGEIKLAQSISAKAISAIGQGNMVPPPVMSDRYLVYRVPEYLQSYLDYTPKSGKLLPLPYERQHTQFFKKAGIASCRTGDQYTISNLAKGGTLKIFNVVSNQCLLNDSGVIGILSNGEKFTTQWIDQRFKLSIDSTEWSVKGTAKYLPNPKTFTPFKGLIFRLIMVAVGWSPMLSHFVKGRIRKLIILNGSDIPLKFSRSILFEKSHITIRDTFTLNRKSISITRMSLGGEYHLRYVPQSRYFQPHELANHSSDLSADELKKLNSERSLSVEREIKI